MVSFERERTRSGSAAFIAGEAKPAVADSRIKCRRFIRGERNTPFLLIPTRFRAEKNWLWPPFDLDRATPERKFAALPKMAGFIFFLYSQ